jgi:hypothetical protein
MDKKLYNLEEGNMFKKFIDWCGFNSEKELCSSIVREQVEAILAIYCKEKGWKTSLQYDIILWEYDHSPFPKLV